MQKHILIELYGDIVEVEVGNKRRWSGMKYIFLIMKEMECGTFSEVKELTWNI